VLKGAPLATEQRGALGAWVRHVIQKARGPAVVFAQPVNHQFSWETKEKNQ
jgi:hypothetical protein